MGTLLCVFTNEFNRQKLNSSLKNQFGMIQTADEPSYIVPPQNWIQKGVWKDNSEGLASYVQRPPGYGILYLCNYLILGKSALLGLKWLQIFFFFMSGLIFWKLLDAVDLNRTWQFAGLTLFMLLPSYSGFVYYSLTEGVTPFFTLWFILESFKAAQTKRAGFSLFLSLAFLLLIRPQLTFTPIFVLLFHLLQRNWKVAFIILGAMMPIFLWYVRTAILTGEKPSTHPIYFTSNNSLYRPTHSTMTDLYRIWEWRSDVFHTHMAIAASSDSLKIETLRSEIPEKLQQDVLPILHQFGKLNRYRITHFQDQKIKGYFKGEWAFIQNLKSIRSKLISENRFDFYVKTPAMSAKEFLNKSYMNLYIFQATFRGNIFVETLRIVCWLVCVISIGLFFLTPFFSTRKSLYFYVFLGMSCFLFYLVFVQRLNEERYIVPLLPLFLIFGARNLARLFKI